MGKYLTWLMAIGIFSGFQFSAHGDELKEWNFSGFASIGAGRLYEDGQRYLTYENKWTMDSDSAIGLQANREFGDQWEFIGQVVANGYNFTQDDLYTPEVEWFLLSYQVDSHNKFRFGRLRNPLYLYSPTLEVGYTYPWVRPSPNAYASYTDPFKHIDGVDFTFSTTHGDADVDYNIIAGRSESNFIGLEIDGSFILGGNVTADWHDATLRFHVEQIYNSIEAPAAKPLADGFALLAQDPALPDEAAAIFQTMSENFGVEDDDATFISISALKEWGDWTFVSEVLHFRSSNTYFANDSDGFYISAAYQMGDWMPYATYGEYHNDFADGLADLAAASEAYIPAGSAAASAELVPGSGISIDGLRQTTIATVNNYDTEQESIVLGVRYDFHPRADFKVEVEYFNFLNGSSGNLNIDEGTPNPDDAVLTSFVIDVVF